MSQFYNCERCGSINEVRNLNCITCAIKNPRVQQPHPPVPPDPEEMNDERADWASNAIEAFRDATRTDIEDAVCDLLSDLAHWCDRNGQDFSHQLWRAINHYDEETGDDGKQFSRITIEPRKGTE